MRIALLAACFSWGAIAATVGPTDRFIPLIHDGGGWSTQIVIVNLSAKNELVTVQFMTTKGLNELWRVNPTTSHGRAGGAQVEADLPPGASMTVDTPGTAATLTRGFADIAGFTEDSTLGAFARLVRRENGQVVESFNVPLSPLHERRSRLAIDTRGGARQELVLISLTSSTLMNLTFRDPAGATVLATPLDFNGEAQLLVDVATQWPQLANFRGTMEWTVSFPNADRYEYRIMAGLSLITTAPQQRSVVLSMTLPADQASQSPY
jgi:hypothetical protein